jgi:3-oxoacyl-[acyl-carrier-protein] synthase II
LKRKANIIAEVVGYGLSGDAFHTTSSSSSSSDGVGAMNSMKMALKDAKISMNQINYVNAHSTSIPKGDDIEISAVTNFENKRRRLLLPIPIIMIKKHRPFMFLP